MERGQESSWLTFKFPTAAYLDSKCRLIGHRARSLAARLYHQCPYTTIGHIAASLLALRLEVDLQRRLDERKIQVSWPDLMRDLAKVQSVSIDLEGSRYRLRTSMTGSSYQAFKAAGARPPETVSLIGPSRPLRPPPRQPKPRSCSAKLP